MPQCETKPHPPHVRIENILKISYCFKMNPKSHDNLWYRRKNYILCVKFRWRHLLAILLLNENYDWMREKKYNYEIQFYVGNWNQICTWFILVVTVHDTKNQPTCSEKGLKSLREKSKKKDFLWTTLEIFCGNNC